MLLRGVRAGAGAQGPGGSSWTADFASDRSRRPWSGSGWVLWWGHGRVTGVACVGGACVSEAHSKGTGQLEPVLRVQEQPRFPCGPPAPTASEGARTDAHTEPSLRHARVGHLRLTRAPARKRGLDQPARFSRLLAGGRFRPLRSTDAGWAFKNPKTATFLASMNL